MSESIEHETSPWKRLDKTDGTLIPLRSGMVVHPGDTLVVTVQDATAEDMERVSGVLKDRLPSVNVVLISDAEVAVVRKGTEPTEDQPVPDLRYFSGPTTVENSPTKIWHAGCGGEVVIWIWHPGATSPYAGYRAPRPVDGTVNGESVKTCVKCGTEARSTAWMPLGAR